MFQGIEIGLAFLRRNASAHKVILPYRSRGGDQEIPPVHNPDVPSLRGRLWEAPNLPLF